MTSEEPSLMAPQKASIPESAALAWSRIAVDLFKAAVWPLVALVVFFSLETPIVKSMNEIPAIIRNTHKLMIGKLTIETILKEAGLSVDIRSALSKISRPGLVFLLDTGRIGWGYLRKGWKADDDRVEAINEMQKEKLIVITAEPPDSSYESKYSLTPQAKEAYEAILKSIADQLTK